jgi:hypothetical protein
MTVTSNGAGHEPMQAAGRSARASAYGGTSLSHSFNDKARLLRVGTGTRLQSGTVPGPPGNGRETVPDLSGDGPGRGRSPVPVPDLFGTWIGGAPGPVPAGNLPSPTAFWGPRPLKAPAPTGEQVPRHPGSAMDGHST